MKKKRYTMLELLPKVTAKPITMNSFDNSDIDLRCSGLYPVGEWWKHRENKVAELEKLRLHYLETKDLNAAVLLFEELNKLPYKWKKVCKH